MSEQPPVEPNAKPPAGWYPDPYGESEYEQYWDGERWMDQRRLSSSTPSPASARNADQQAQAAESSSNPQDGGERSARQRPGGFSRPPLWHVQPGEDIGGFHLEDEIGRGGMGIVYLAVQLSLGRKVALKVMAPALAEDPEFQERFEREAQTAASIDHPNVVPVYEAGTADGVLYLAMRYVPGTDLKSLLAAAGPLTPSHAAGMAAQVGAALDAAHGMGLIHRDVKPGNILFAGETATSHVYLTDFGLTKASTAVSGLTHTGEWVGTVDYVAPEQLDRDTVDARTDVYALGCVLFHALAGRSPFSGGDVQKMWAHMHTQAPTLLERSPELAQRFDPVIARAMAKNPDDRFQSAGDLGRAAEAAAAGAPVPIEQGVVASPGSVPNILGALAPIAAGQRSGASTRPQPAPPQQRGASEPPTRVLDKPRRSMASVVAIAVGVVVLVVGVAAGAILATRSSSDGSSQPQVSQQVNHRNPERAKPSQPHLNFKKKTPNSQAPIAYSHYGASSSGGYSARLPADPGWSVQPEANQNGPGESPLWRTIVTGPSGVKIWIDYTSDQPAGDPGGTVTSTVAVPGFGRVAEGHQLSSCSSFGSPGPCIDYIAQIHGGTQGIAVLGFGGNPALAATVAKRIASSLTPAGQ